MSPSLPRVCSISILSQFRAEEEVLFPPCTMLLVHQREEGIQIEEMSSVELVRKAHSVVESSEGQDGTNSWAKKQYMAIKAKPFFV